MSPVKLSISPNKSLWPEECIACLFSAGSGPDGILYFSLFSASPILHIKISNGLQALRCLNSLDISVTDLCL